MSDPGGPVNRALRVTDIWIVEAGRRFVGSFVAAVLLGCRGPDIHVTPEGRACDPESGLTSYRIKGNTLVGDVDGDGRTDRVTVRADRRRPPRCRHKLVVETRVGNAAAVPVKPLAWPGTDPQLRLLAQIDGHAGLEPVVELSPAAVSRPGAVFTMRDGELVRMRLEVEANLPDDLFALDDEFPAGVNCAAKLGTIVATFGNLAERDDSHFDITRSF